MVTQMGMKSMGETIEEKETFAGSLGYLNADANMSVCEIGHVSTCKIQENR